MGYEWPHAEEYFRVASQNFRHVVVAEMSGSRRRRISHTNLYEVLYRKQWRTSLQRNNLKICRCVPKLNVIYAVYHLRGNIANLAGVEASASIVIEVPLHTKLGVEVPPQSTPFETLFRCPPLLKCGHGPRIIVDTLVTVRFL